MKAIFQVQTLMVVEGWINFLFFIFWSERNI